MMFPTFIKTKWFKGIVWLAGLACVTLLVSLAAAPPRAEPLQFGLYQILWSRNYGKHLRDTFDKLASKPSYVTFYRDLGRPFPKFAIDAIGQEGATAIVSLELWSWHGQRSGAYLPAINDGHYDEFFRQWAKDAKQDGRRVLLRFGFEFNGNWFSWSGDPKAFVKAWRRAYDIFKQVGASNVEWVWAPNILSCPDTPENNMHLYYPGEAFVDWVGVDGYNFGEHHDQWHHWQMFGDIFGDLLSDFRTRYAGKPLMITEFGCAPGESDQREKWIRDAYKFLQTQPQVKAVIWFNLDKRREKEPNWRIDVTPESLQAFNETFAKPTK